MAFRSKFLLLSAFISVVHSAPSSVDADFTLKESFTPPASWMKYGAAPLNQPLTLRIYLSQPNQSLLEQRLLTISDPYSESYGQHLTVEEVNAFAAPARSSLDALDDWLTSHGFHVDDRSWSPSLNSVKINTTISKAQDMLNTTYNIWKHAETGVFLTRATEWSLPSDIADHIALIHPTSMFINPTTQRKRRKVSELEDRGLSSSTPEAESSLAVNPSCKTSITPSCLLSIYNVPAEFRPRTQAHSKNSVAVASFLDEFANLEDLKIFEEKFAPNTLGSSFQVISINGGKNSQNLRDAGTEADLDTQYMFSLSNPIPAFVYATGGLPPFLPDAASSTDDNEPYLNFIDFLLANPKTISPTISISYVDDEQSVPLSYAQQVCNGFAQLGSMGVSVLFASGDGGVGSNLGDGFCVSNDGKNRTTFIPTFPASCPFVTTVGATTSFGPEVAVKSFASGGGFSNYFSAPQYQKQVVEAFLNSLGNKYRGLYNAKGRGYPDIAAQGDNFQTILSGKLFVNGGTSASTPTVAALIAMLNDARLAAGKSTMGFLNPFLYSIGSAGLTDITSGSNPGCGTPGFSCAKGWDPVTGLGTPNFGKLLEIALKI